MAKARKELASWQAHYAAALQRGSIKHLLFASEYSRFGEVRTASYLFRRPRRISAALRKVVTRDADGAYRIFKRIDGTDPSEFGAA